MIKAKLKKYSHLGLLALAIVAGVVAVAQKQPDQDAGYDVIGYFYCSDKYYDELPKEFVLVRSKQGFAQLVYGGMTRSWGKPKDLSYFRTRSISNAKETPRKFSFSVMSDVYSLDRETGTLYQGVFAFDKTGQPKSPSANHYFECKFGEEGKRLVWGSALKTYEERKQKF